MSDHKRGYERTCGNCGRVTSSDLSRHFCPVTAWDINYRKPADRCNFYVRTEDQSRHSDGHKRNRR